MLLRLLACAMIPLLAVAAQDRRPTFVSVVDGAGGSAADAVVTLIGGDPHLAASLQDVDVVRVQADDRGRALPKLLAHLSYVAWAERDGVRSPVQGYFSAGALLDLVLQEPAATRAIDVQGLDAWAELGELRCVAMTMVPGTEQDLERDEQGRVLLPAMPFDSFEVRLADGTPLWRTLIGEGATIRVPPPQEVRVLAVDEAGQPLAGAHVVQRVGHVSSWRLDGLRGVGEERLRPLGKTDEQGRCVVRVPYDGDPLQRPRADMLLFVQAPGRPAVAGGVWLGSLYASDHRVRRIEGDELRFECRSVEPLVGSVPGAPKGTVAHLSAICKLYMSRGGHQNDPRVFTADVRANGSFVFDDVPAELHSCRLSLVPPTDSDWVAPVFAPEASRQLPPELRQRLEGPPLPFEFGTVSFEVLDARGGPARGAVAFVSSGEHRGVLLRDSLIRVPLDSRGSTSLRLVPGKWVVVVVTTDAFGARSFDVEGVDAQVELQLEPLASMVVTLRDRDGAPVEGARVRSRGTTTQGTSDPVDSILQGLQRTRHVHWSRLRTDGDGRVEVPFVPVNGVLQRLELRWEGGVSEEFALQAGAERELGPKSEPAPREAPRRR